MMWEAATGKRLWKGVPDITILQRLLSGEIPSPRSVKPELPEKLEAIILKALSHQRDDRYETAADLQNAVDAYLEETGEARVGARRGQADRGPLRGRPAQDQGHHRGAAPRAAAEAFALP